MTEVTTEKIVRATVLGAETGLKALFENALKFTEDDLKAGNITEAEAVGIVAGLTMAWKCWGMVADQIERESAEFGRMLDALSAAKPAEDAFPGNYL